MPRSSEQKLKILYLLKILNENTDAEHSISTEDILSKLSAYGIEAERKSIYTDIASLCDYGINIECTRGKNGGYRLTERDFEFSELKLLVDAVQASKFITEQKSAQLIKKLEGLTSLHNAKLLQHSVIMHERVKTMNESVFGNVDAIQLAIGENRQISFKYFDWNMRKERVFRKDGALYRVSPLALTWDDENYYLVAYDSAADMIKHYRVDKMFAIQRLKEKRDVTDDKRFDIAKYSKAMFGMYGGETKKVKLRCAAKLAGAVFDRFGQGIIITPDGDFFETIVNVAVSPVFFAWVMQFGGEIKITAPSEIIESFRELAEKNLK